MYLGKIRNSGQIADKPNFWQKEKPTNGFVKPNVSCAYGDPYGNRKSPIAMCIFSKNQKSRITKPFATYLKKRTFSNFLRFFVTIKNKQRTSLRRVSVFDLFTPTEKVLIFSTIRCIIKETRKAKKG